MRHVITMMLLVSILVLIIQCNRQESINSLMGRTEIATAPDTSLYEIGPFPPDEVPISASVITDSIRWVNEFPSGGSSSLKIIISGQSQLDLDVETYLDGVTTTVPLIRDNTGIFADTVQIAATPLSEVILTESSRLFVRYGDQVLDSIPLVNPWQY